MACCGVSALIVHDSALARSLEQLETAYIAPRGLNEPRSVEVLRFR